MKAKDATAALRAAAVRILPYVALLRAAALFPVHRRSGADAFAFAFAAIRKPPPPPPSSSSFASVRSGGGRGVRTTMTTTTTTISRSSFLPPPSLLRASAEKTASSSSSSSAANSDDVNENDTPPTLPPFSSEAEYLDYISKRSKLPRGFAAGTASGRFVPEESPSMGELTIRGNVIYLTDGPSESWAAVFTKNKFPGAPVKVGRSRLASSAPLQAIVINNKVSNVCSSGDGISDSERVCEAAASALNIEGGGGHVLPCSTGVIGWRLPAETLAEEVVPRAVESMKESVKEGSGSIMDVAGGIMTTDRYRKVRSKTLSNGARIVGIAKGAGMIEPNMATMLSYLLTDAAFTDDVPKPKLQSVLSDVVDQSFNSISVDGDESTSDTVVLLSSDKVDGTDADEFADALLEVTAGLASDVVRNGEGTSHVMRVSVVNFPGSDGEARRLGRHVVDSPLFKCAVSGNDPNIGRLAGAVGSFMGEFHEDADLHDVTLSIGGRPIFAGGKFTIDGDETERELSRHMKDAMLGEEDAYPAHQKFVEIGVDFGGGGGGTATVLGSDLTAEYVSVNADYRS